MEMISKIMTMKMMRWNRNKLRTGEGR